MPKLAYNVVYADLLRQIEGESSCRGTGFLPRMSW